MPSKKKKTPPFPEPEGGWVSWDNDGRLLLLHHYLDGFIDYGYREWKNLQLRDSDTDSNLVFESRTIKFLGVVSFPKRCWLEDAEVDPVHGYHTRIGVPVRVAPVESNELRSFVADRFNEKPNPLPKSFWVCLGEYLVDGFATV